MTRGKYKLTFKKSIRQGWGFRKTQFKDSLDADTQLTDRTEKQSSGSGKSKKGEHGSQRQRGGGGARSTKKAQPGPKGEESTM